MIKLLKTAITGLVAAGVVLVTSGNVWAAEKSPVKKSAKTDSVVVVKVEKPVPANKLLFFMNPNGRPCQMQDEILTKIKDTLAGLAPVTYIKTTVPNDRDAFFTYGIRGLPSLIIVDEKGKEVKRFTPGIQSAEAVLAALRKTSK